MKPNKYYKLPRFRGAFCYMRQLYYHGSHCFKKQLDPYAHGAKVED